VDKGVPKPFGRVKLSRRWIVADTDRAGAQRGGVERDTAFEPAADVTEDLRISFERVRVSDRHRTSAADRGQVRHGSHASSLVAPAGRAHAFGQRLHRIAPEACEYGVSSGAPRITKLIRVALTARFDPDGRKKGTGSVYHGEELQ